MSHKLITLNQVEVSYGNKTVLRNVDLEIKEKDFLGIIGPNGGGKTTLVKAILGLIPISRGNITYYYNDLPTANIKLGYLPQYSSIDKKFPISVYEVVRSGLNSEKKLWQRFSREHHERTRALIARMGLEGLENRAIGSLSGGQMQRALIARAVVSNPQAVVLDEPNTYIDKRSEDQLYRLLEEINRECAIVLVSHDIGSVLQNVRAIACVNETLDYHPDTLLPPDWIEEHFQCPMDLIGHGHIPHRVLASHAPHQEKSAKPH